MITLKKRVEKILTEVFPWVYYHIPRLNINNSTSEEKKLSFTHFGILSWLRFEKAKNPKRKITNLQLRKMLWADLDLKLYHRRMGDLLDLGLVQEGKRFGKDRRTYEVMITKKGLKVLKEAETSRQKFISEETSSMKEEEADSFFSIIDIISEKIHKQILEKSSVD